MTPTEQVALAARAGSSRYLPGLDGVRAVAIIGVLLFHLGLSRFTGGFLGVDVFFTLSGFLITGIVLNELSSTGRLRFGNFYLRRARRLLPALILMLAVTSVLVLVFARDAAHDFGVDARAAMLYVTNWWYVVDARGYFDLTGRPPLLQHLWSLAVEEQFYLVWPLIVYGAFRWGGRRRVALVAAVGAVASTLLMAAVSIATDVPSVADSARVYFGTDTHASTLLVGAVLAVVWNPHRVARITTDRGRRLVSAAGLVGLLGLAACFLWASGDSAWLFRGGFLLVGLLSALVVAAASISTTVFARALAVAPLRYLGTRSYGIYLWHWPVFQLTRPDRDIALDGLPAMALSVGLTLTIAEFSYRYVEMPVRDGALGRWFEAWRRRPTRPERRRAVVGGAIAALVATTLGLQAALAASPDPGPATYLGGETAIGAGPLAPVADPGSTPKAARPGTVTAVGDSVLLGARRELRAAIDPLVLDAAIGRQPGDVLDRVAERRSLGRLGSVVVVSPGANGYVPTDDVDAMLRSLQDRSRVVILTSRAAKEWVAPSNANIKQAAARHPNATVVDWARFSRGHRDWFYPDAIHLTPKGAKAYATAVAAAVDGE